MRALLAGLIAVCVGLTTALISPTAKAADPYLTVSMTRTDTYGAPVRAGEVLTFSISYTNVSTRVVTAFPTSSNLAETLPPTAPNCRYADLAAGVGQIGVRAAADRGAAGRRRGEADHDAPPPAARPRSTS